MLLQMFFSIVMLVFGKQYSSGPNIILFNGLYEKKHICLVSYTQQFGGTILSMVFDLRGRYISEDQHSP